MSISIGITVLPARLTRVAPAGTRTSAAPPACAILAPSTTSVAFSITRPSPTISRAPSNAVTDCADASSRTRPVPTATIAAIATAFTRRMEASFMKRPLPFDFGDGQVDSHEAVTAGGLLRTVGSPPMAWR